MFVVVVCVDCVRFCCCLCFALLLSCLCCAVAFVICCCVCQVVAWWFLYCLSIYVISLVMLSVCCLLLLVACSSFVVCCLYVSAFVLLVFMLCFVCSFWFHFGWFTFSRLRLFVFVVSCIVCFVVSIFVLWFCGCFGFSQFSYCSSLRRVIIAHYCSLLPIVVHASLFCNNENNKAAGIHNFQAGVLSFVLVFV